MKRIKKINTLSVCLDNIPWCSLLCVIATVFFMFAIVVIGGIVVGISMIVSLIAATPDLSERVFSISGIKWMAVASIASAVLLTIVSYISVVRMEIRDIKRLSK